MKMLLMITMMMVMVKIIKLHSINVTVDIDQLNPVSRRLVNLWHLKKLSCKSITFERCAATTWSNFFTWRCDEKSKIMHECLRVIEALAVYERTWAGSEPVRYIGGRKASIDSCCIIVRSVGKDVQHRHWFL